VFHSQAGSSLACRNALYVLTMIYVGYALFHVDVGRARDSASYQLGTSQNAKHFLQFQDELPVIFRKLVSVELFQQINRFPCDSAI
jgi:hypothetical protein